MADPHRDEGPENWVEAADGVQYFSRGRRRLVQCQDESRESMRPAS